MASARRRFWLGSRSTISCAETTSCTSSSARPSRTPARTTTPSSGDLASTTNLEAEAQTHADIDRLRTIRAYAPEGFDAGKLREAIKVEQEANGNPGLVILEGFDLSAASPDDVAGFKALAEEIQAEVWLSHGCEGESVPSLPADVEAVRDQFGVILALEPETDSVVLKALKEHDNPDAQALRVALDPKTLLLTRH